MSESSQQEGQSAICLYRALAPGNGPRSVGLSMIDHCQHRAASLVRPRQKNITKQNKTYNVARSLLYEMHTVSSRSVEEAAPSPHPAILLPDSSWLNVVIATHWPLDTSWVLTDLHVLLGGLNWLRLDDYRSHLSRRPPTPQDFGIFACFLAAMDVRDPLSEKSREDFTKVSLQDTEKNTWKKAASYSANHWVSACFSCQRACIAISSATLWNFTEDMFRQLQVAVQPYTTLNCILWSSHCRLKELMGCISERCSGEFLMKVPKGLIGIESIQQNIRFESITQLPGVCFQNSLAGSGPHNKVWL